MSMAFHIGNAAADQTVELDGEIMEVMSQLPLSERVERGITECKSFQGSNNSRAESGNIIEEVQELRRDTPEEQGKAEAGRFLRDEGLDIISAHKATTVKRMNANAAERTLRARPMRLTAWPVTEQQVGYLQRASFG
jgi:hypothetical protein